jgi:hypothetical protein
MQYWPFFIHFSCLLYLGHLSLPGLETKTRRQSTSSTFCSFKSYNPIIRRHSWAPRQARLCMLLASAHKKCLAQKVVRFGSLGWIPMIQPPFNSSCAALQYETGTKFFHRAVPEIHDIENHKISVQPRGVFHIFSKFYRVSDHINPRISRTCQGKASLSFLGRRHHHPDGFFLNSTTKNLDWTVG